MWADFLAESRRFSGRKLITLFGDADSVRHPPLDDLQQLNGKDLLLCGEFLRRHHSRLAHEIALFGVPGPSGRILKLLTTDDTSHVVDLAGLVARSHGLSIRDCFEYLQTQYSSVKVVRGIHPTFLMALLRIADILQIQSNRAPKQVLKVRQLKSPVSSDEWEMHQAIKDTSSKEYPETIWVVAKPENVKTYLRIRKLLDQIQAELDSSWTVIGEVYGYDPEFREFGLKIRRVRSNIDDIASFSKQIPYIPVQASFEVADTDLLKLLIGPLYGSKAEIGIRELIQNSVDAVLELREYSEKNKFKINHLDLRKQDGDITVIINQDQNDDWWLTISDCGIGMTANTIREYFLKAGASLRRSELWKQAFEDETGKSRVLRSGRFGVGALAAFLIGSEIQVSTRYVENSSNEGISFTARLDSESIELIHSMRPIGTTISIKMNKESVNSLMPNSNDNLDEIRKKELLWDWYCLDNPLIMRSYNDTNEKLEQRYNLPNAGTTLPPHWQRIKHADYKDILWTYDDAPVLTCNGIRVTRIRTRRPLYNKNNNIDSCFLIPNVSVFDPDANLPLNLQRSGLSQDEFPFQEQLLVSVIKDFIAFLLINAPSESITNSSALSWYIDPKNFRALEMQFIRGGVSRGGNLGLVPWYTYDLGFGLWPELVQIKQVGKDSVLVESGEIEGSVYVRRENFTANVQEIYTQQPTLRYFMGGRYSSKWENYSAALEELFLFGSRGAEIYQALYKDHRIEDPYYSSSFLHSKRVLVSRNHFNKLQELSTIKDLGFKDSLSFLQYINPDKEWENKNWTLWKVDQCPEPTFDFIKYAEQNSTNTDSPNIVTELYFNKNNNIETSTFSKIWEAVIGRATIPFDRNERYKQLAHTYEYLKDYIEAHKEIRRQ